MTDRWMRSPRGKILGVATGLAEWRDLPAEPVRIIVFLLIIMTGIFPGVAIYLAAAFILPLEGDDSPYQRAKRRDADHIYRNAEDAEYRESKSTEDLKAEYEALKKKVEEMESEMFDKEKDWDERFNSSK